MDGTYRFSEQESTSGLAKVFLGDETSDKSSLFWVSIILTLVKKVQMAGVDEIEIKVIDQFFLQNRVRY